MGNWSIIKGRNYQSTIYRQFVLFPQQAGKLTIDAARFDASIAKATQVADPFEAFFNGGSNYVEVKKTILTPQLTIDVKPCRQVSQPIFGRSGRVQYNFFYQ